MSEKSIVPVDDGEEEDDADFGVLQMPSEDMPGNAARQASGGRTYSAPGPVDATGQPGGGGADQKKKDDRPSEWNLDWKFDDDFVMSRNKDGSVTLTDPNGAVGKWDAGANAWVDAGGKSLSADWAGGHLPVDWSDAATGKPKG